MQLNTTWIPAWVRWQQPEGHPADWAAAEARLLEQINQDPECLALRLLALDGERIQASLSLAVFQPGVLTFAAPRCGPEVPARILLDLIKEALVTAQRRGARLQCRLPETPQLQPVLAALPGLGARLSHTRVEYGAPLASLPAETGSPFCWAALEPLGPYSLAQAAEILTAAGQGDPDWDPADDALELLQAYLDDEALSSGPECVQIALLQDQPAGIVIAQVHSVSLWSRITYMGLLPAFRGQGLGQWLHRHGFAMMRAQGGQSYHGGTVQGNAAMEALFRSQGCQLEQVLQEWHWPAPAA